VIKGHRFLNSEAQEAVMLNYVNVVLLKWHIKRQIIMLNVEIIRQGAIMDLIVFIVAVKAGINFNEDARFIRDKRLPRAYGWGTIAG